MTPQKWGQRDWKELERFYAELAIDWKGKQTIVSMRKLCSFIEIGELNGKLFGFTSHADLWISQFKSIYPVDNYDQFLVITPRSDFTIEFKFQSWAKVIHEENLKPHLSKFLNRVGWIYPEREIGLELAPQG